MARPPRIEYNGALYHAMSRGLSYLLQSKIKTIPDGIIFIWLWG